jgi:hypothetical protein
MKLYVGFSHSREFKIGSKAIAWWMGEEYSHVYFRFEYADSKDAIFHAAHGMVHFMSLANFNRHNVTVREYEIELTPEQHSQMFDDCMELAGVYYSKLELLQIFISDLTFTLLHREIHWNDDPGYICSELVGTLCVSTLGVKFSKPLNLLKPKDIDLALAAAKIPVKLTE